MLRFSMGRRLSARESPPIGLKARKGPVAVKFLFWNLKGQSVETCVANLSRLHDVDVLILAECAIPPGKMLSAICAENDTPFHLTKSLCEKLVVYTRFSAERLTPLYEDPNSMSIRRLLLPDAPEVLLVLAHLPSKLRRTSASQNQHCTEIARTIREREDEVGHARTIVVGDLNMNPFEEGIVAATGLHATLARPIAESGKRKVQGKEYPFFYNPMWGHFGHTSDGPPGTYHYRRGEHVEYFWNIFNHVLVRPKMLQYFQDDLLRILTTDGERSLVSNNGLPKVSDHLPILFELAI